MHTCVTSPPYYGLRDYGVAGQIGLEATPDEYLQTMVEVFREVRRVLRDDGTCWVNMGDSYATQPAGNFGKGKRDVGPFDGYRSNIAMDTTKHAKPKDLLMMPARLALALQADGWWLRSDIIWAKPNPMPESVSDRPTTAHEHVFLLSKRSKYYYDNEGVREPLQESTLERGYSPAYLTGIPAQKMATAPDDVRAKANWRANAYVPSGRNLRNVWTIATAPFSAAHFATFPPELAERSIRAGTSERGCCAQCGKPWVRTTDVSYTDAHRGMVGNQRKAVTDDRVMHAGRENDVRMDKRVVTTGWQPGCPCEARCLRMGCRSSGSPPLLVDGVCPKCGTRQQAEPVPCTVLDPFAGAGTTLLVADRLQRNAVGIELNADYTTMAMERCRRDAPLFADLAPVPSEDAYDRDMRDLFATAAD